MNNYIRKDGPTPNGGVYSIIYFYDEEGNSTTQENAVVAYGCEFDENDNMIYETMLFNKKETENDIMKNDNHY